MLLFQKFKLFIRNRLGFFFRFRTVSIKTVPLDSGGVEPTPATLPVVVVVEVWLSALAGGLAPVGF